MPVNQKPDASDTFINVLIGASDGLIIPPALLGGFAIAGSGHGLIIKAGLAYIGVSALIMGIGGYLTRRNAELQPKNLVHEEIRGMKAGMDREQTRTFFANLGLTEDMQEQAIAGMDKDEEEWKNFIDQYDLDPPSINAGRSGIIIAMAYAGAGVLSLLPYLLIETVMTSLVWSVTLCAPLLFMLGYTKGRLTTQGAPGKGLLLMLTGLLTVAAACGAVLLFKK